MDADDLQARTHQFALRVLRVVDALPKTTAGRAIANQLVRSGTAVGANYRAARRARSTKEFIAKIGVVVEEADESAYWLELIVDAELMASTKINDLKEEAQALTRIFAKTRKSTSTNRH